MLLVVAVVALEEWRVVLLDVLIIILIKCAQREAKKVVTTPNTRYKPVQRCIYTLVQQIARSSIIVNWSCNAICRRISMRQSPRLESPSSWQVWRFKGLELQTLKSIVPGTSSKRKNSCFKWKFQLVGANKTFWQRITYDIYIDFHHRIHSRVSLFYTSKSTIWEDSNHPH